MAKAAAPKSKRYEYPDQVLEPGTVVSILQGRVDYGRCIVLDMAAEGKRLGKDLLGPWPLVERTIPVRGVRGGAYMWIDPAWIYKTESVHEVLAAEFDAVAQSAEQSASELERKAKSERARADSARERAKDIREKASK